MLAKMLVEGEDGRSTLETSVRSGESGNVTAGIGDDVD